MKLPVMSVAIAGLLLPALVVAGFAGCTSTPHVDSTPRRVVTILNDPG